MSELAGAMRLIKGMGLNVMRYPSGSWGFVGRVPATLAYVKADGTVPTNDELRQVTQSSNPAWTCKSLGIETRCFASEQEARDAAQAEGFEIVN